jgi:hypothetical protein
MLVQNSFGGKVSAELHMESATKYELFLWVCGEFVELHELSAKQIAQIDRWVVEQLQDYALYLQDMEFMESVECLHEEQ